MHGTEGSRAKLVLEKENYYKEVSNLKAFLQYLDITSSVHFPAPCHHTLLQEELQNLFRSGRSSRPGCRCTLFPNITGQRSQVFLFVALRYLGSFLCHLIFLKWANIHDFSDLFYSSTYHRLVQIREYRFGGYLFQNVWVVALELAGDMLQLALQMH